MDKEAAGGGLVAVRIARHISTTRANCTGEDGVPVGVNGIILPFPIITASSQALEMEPQGVLGGGYSAVSERSSYAVRRTPSPGEFSIRPFWSAANGRKTGLVQSEKSNTKQLQYLEQMASASQSHNQSISQSVTLTKNRPIKAAF